MEPRHQGSSTYENALVAMHELLEKTKIAGWARRIEEHLLLWRKKRDTSAHLGIYGGMGSFNDVIICKENGHVVSDLQEPWVNELFTWLKAVIFASARKPESCLSFEELSHSVGRHSPSLAATVGGERVPASMQGLVTDRVQLQGWRCINCGHCRVNRRDLHYLIAGSALPQMVLQAAEKLALPDLVEKVLSLDFGFLQTQQAELRVAIEAASIHYIDGPDPWHWNCPECQSRHTSVCRWDLTFAPSVLFTLEKGTPPVGSPERKTDPAFEQAVADLKAQRSKLQRKPWWQFW